ncbi:hypothetical protein LCGC14_1958660 [marine sediment metagenome]|uniref:Radical SAM core domain-containing protein n=1 Tax=marine sediment metagenome TaxID=412755 RepID=A0A0F9FF67_9ZZZZ
MTATNSVSLRISVTDRCQLRCPYCMPPEGIAKCDHSEVLRFEEILRFVRVLNDRFALTKVHLTGGEPLLRPGILELVAMLAAEGLGDLAMTTNGLQLAEMAGGLRRAGLDRVNVSLDSLDGGTYQRLSRGGSPLPVMAGIRAARDSGLDPVKLNAVILRGLNDAEVVPLARWALDNGCHVRFLELMPIGCAKEIFQQRFVPATEIRAKLAEAFDLAPLAARAGQSSRNFLASDAVGRRGIVGLISPQTQPFCRECRRLRLTSTGRLVSCLASGLGPSVRDVLRSDSADADNDIERIVAAELAGKCVRGDFTTDRAMPLVGG